MKYNENTGRLREQERLREDAARWCVVMSSGKASDAEKRAFAEWITHSPSHLREFKAVEALWAEAASFGAALDSASDVIPMYPSPKSAGRSLQPGAARSALRRLTQWRHGLAAALIAGCIGLAAYGLSTGGPEPWLFGPDVESFATRKGESRLMTLADGSLLELNTQSRVEVRFLKASRRIRLLEGEAYFDVVSDPERPFIVDTEQARVQAVGTEFNVRLRAADVAVTVVEGQVLVSQLSAGNDDAPIGWEAKIGQNEQAVVGLPRRAESATVAQTRPVEVEQFVSWRDNKLVFEATPLREVVGDFNRYNSMVLRIEDESLMTLSVSGVFDPRDPKAFVQTLEAFAPVRALVLGRSMILLKPL
ncbi:MAG: FecR domain-containing protein [Xanthomonadales bacterium]|nr:FecR domain-containing protein [Xanthomonadales bacterium]